MTDIKPMDILIGFTIFTIIVLGSITAINIAQTDNSGFVDKEYDQYKESANKSIDLQNDIDSLESKIRGSGKDPSTLEAIQLLFLKGNGVLMNLFTGWDFMEESVTGLGRQMNFIIPSWFPTIVISLLTIVLVFTLVGALLQRDI